MNRHGMKTWDTGQFVLALGLWTLISVPAAIAETESPEELKARADALIAAHSQINQERDLDAARRDLEQARDLYVRLGDAKGQIDALLRLGLLGAKANDPASVTASFAAALPLLEAAEDTMGVWALHLFLGDTARRGGDPAAAEAQFREALTALDTLQQGDTPISLETMAIFSEHIGVSAELLQTIAPLVDMVRPLFLRQYEAMTRLSLGSALSDRGRYEEASASFERARQLSQPFGLLDVDIEREIERMRAARAQATGGATAPRLGEKPKRAAQPRPGEGSAASEPVPQDTAAKAEADELLAEVGPLTGDVELGRARTLIEKALTRYEQAGDADGRLTCLLLLGKVRYQMDGHAAAMETYRRAWELVEAEDNSFDQWMLRMAMGSRERIEGRYPEALAHLEQALGSLAALRRDHGPIRYDVLLRLGQQAGLSLDRVPMLELWKSIMPAGCEVPALDGPLLEMLRPIVLDLMESETRAELGNTLVAMERYDEAATFLDQAPGFPTPSSLTARADLRQRQGQHQAARELYQEALAWQQGLPSWLSSGNRITDMLANPALILDGLDELGWRTGQPQDLSHWRRALEQAQQDNDPVREAQVLLGMGSAHLDLLQLAEAQPLFEQALALARRTGLGDLGAQALEELSLIHLAASRFEAAIRTLEQALAIRRRLGNKWEQANILSNLGQLYGLTGSYEQGLDMLQKARRLTRELEEEPLLETVVGWRIAYIERMLGSDEKSRTADREVLRWLQTEGRHGSSVSTLLGLLRVVDGPEHAEDVLDRARQGVARARELDSPFLDMTSRLAMAMALSSQGRCVEARDTFEEVLAGCRGWPCSTELEAMAEFMLGALMWEEGDVDGAIALFAQSIDRLEQVQAQVKVEDLLAKLIHERWHMLYELMIEALVRRERGNDAFAYAERARARAFLRQIGNVRLERGRVGDPVLVAEAEDLRHRSIELERELANARQSFTPFGDDDRTGELQWELDEARAAYQHMLVRLKFSDPEYASLVGVEPISPEALQEQVLDDDTTLVAYHVNAGRTLAWVIDRRAVQMVPIAIGHQALATEVRYFRNLIAERRPEAESVAGALHRTLIAPLVPYLRHRNLIIVPHGPLHLLPFAALRDVERRRYLLADYTLTYVPSASVLRFLAARQTPNKGWALVLGDPDGSLPHAAAEATAVARLLGTAPLLGSGATESRIYAHAGRVDLLHFAAHATYDATRPRFSRIDLAPDGANDGHLEVHEIIKGLDLSGVNLVVLSACRTALGARTRGDELVGMTRAFLHAGSPAVVTTLWAIEDEASAALMESFYRHLRDGATTAAALRSAQLEVMEQEDWRSPYYWAAFALNGDGRGRW